MARPIGQEMQMLSSNPGLPLDNKLLSSLLREQIDQLTPHMTTKQLPQGTVLPEAGEEFHSTVASGTRFHTALNSHRRCSRIDGRLVSRFAVQFGKVNQHQPVRRLTAILTSANMALSSRDAIRARSLAFPSHNGTPYDLTSARSPLSHCSWHSSCASRRLLASNTRVGVPPVSMVKIEGKTFVIFPVRLQPASTAAT
jgi:hypothetical protein